MPASAPLSKPITSRKPLKRTSTPSMSQSQRGKRPRPSNDEVEPLKKKENNNNGTTTSNSVGTMNGNGLGGGSGGGGIASLLLNGEGNAMRKGMYLAFIDDAFTKRNKGNNEKYQELISQFKALLPNTSLASTSSSSSSTLPPTTSQLRIWLDALTHVVSKLDKSHSPLVETILAIPWATMEENFVLAYIRFIAALVSARAEWLRGTLEKCVKGFRYRSNYTTFSSSSLPSITRRTLYTRLHTLLRTLLSLIPTLPSSLSPLLAQNFPSKRESIVSQICYIDNLLAISLYCPGLAEDVLSVIVERALGLDVEIQGEPEEWEEVEEEMAEEESNNVAGGRGGRGSGRDGKENKALGIGEVVDRPTGEDQDSDDSDDDDDDGGDESSDSDDEPNPIGDEEAERLKSKSQASMSRVAIQKVLENRSKLDAILKVVFDHLASTHAGISNSTTIGGMAEMIVGNGNGNTTPTETTPTPESLASPELIARRLALFRALLDIFDRLLLRTFKTRNTQFLIFYLCSLDHSSSDHFVGVLLGRALFEVEAPAVTRVAAAGYVASYISRAKFVDAGMTRKVVRHLCQFLEVEMDDQSSSTTKAGQSLPVFYAVAQALFYIFCFRWKDLLDEGDDDEIGLVETGRRWMLGLETVKKAVASSFNPLKVCAQAVVTQFASIAHKTNFIYCYAILDSNRRGGTSNSNSRESFPLPLPNSTNSHSMMLPPTPLRSISSSDSNGLLRRQSLSLSTNPCTPISAGPRQLLVAEEMDSFFPFDPFKLPLSSIYVEDIYNDWIPDDDDEDASETEDSSASSESTDDSDDSDLDSDDENGVAVHSGAMGMNMTRNGRGGGLAVPGSGQSWEEESDFVSRSFEAMSLSPERGFGGRESNAGSGAGGGGSTGVRPVVIR